jgi:hypothetical protein
MVGLLRLPRQQEPAFFDNLSRFAGVSAAGAGVPGTRRSCAYWGENPQAKP